MAMPALIGDTLTTWGSFYANHATVRTAVTFAHVGGLVTGGGAAIAEDRALLGAARGDVASWRAAVAAMAGIHRTVMTALIVIAASGLLLFASDAETFLQSRLFWTKATLVLLLATNGLFLIGAERRALRDIDGNDRSRLRLAARLSLALWFATMLAGVALPNIG